MKKERIYLEDIGVRTEIARFRDEMHAMLHVEPRGEGFKGQLDRIQKAEAWFQAGGTIVFKRYFLSDIANQGTSIKADCAVSMIQQPPLDGSKVAVWIYLRSGCEVEMQDGTAVVKADGCEHYWSPAMTCAEGDCHAQTESLLTAYEAWLNRHGMTMEADCIRTWFCVRDVDTKYKGMVEARKGFFETHGMTTATHYISSTGIGGLPQDSNAMVQFNAYAAKGGRQRYLHAPTHLNPTSEYGVTFERGTVLQLPDRQHVFISGTASIGNRGEVLFEGDIVRQTQRMWENVEALLTEATATFDDIAQIVVYLRDVADHAIVSRMFAERFPDTPCVITLAPVCRPTWLIEMECIAITPHTGM